MHAAPAALWVLGLASVTATAQAPTQFELQAPPPITGLNLSKTLTVDVDNDGDLDVLGTSPIIFWDALHLLRNDGNGRFVDRTSQQMPGFLQRIHGVTPFDCDGDGDVDLFLHGSDNSNLLRNDGSGGFTIAGTLLWQQSMVGAPGDFDGDGDLDLMRAHDIGTVSLATNDGAGNFTDASSRLPPPPLASYHLHAADLDGDGDAEVLTCLQGTPTLLLRNRHLQLEVGAAVRGQIWNVTLWNEPGYGSIAGLAVLGIGLARLPAPLPLPPFGGLQLDLTGAVLVADTIPVSTGQRTFSFPVPGAPQLLGIELNAQGLVTPSSGPMQLTALAYVAIQ